MSKARGVRSGPCCWGTMRESNAVSPEPAMISEGSDGKQAAQVALLQWYEQNQRDLPWRRGSDPFRVLISEIMLQQTQVDRVVPYFESFVARFPSFEAL